MAIDWAADVRKYRPNADDAAIAGIVRYCGIALEMPQPSRISLTDFNETRRLRDGFLRTKLGLAYSDGQFDAAIAKVAGLLQSEDRHNQVTVYYLLADYFGMLTLFSEEQVPASDYSAPHPPLGSAGKATLGAGGEAVALFTGAPISGAADAAIGLGEVIVDREAKLEEAITGRHEAPAPQIDETARAGAPLLWVLLIVIVVAALIWRLRA